MTRALQATHPLNPASSRSLMEQRLETLKRSPCPRIRQAPTISAGNGLKDQKESWLTPILQSGSAKNVRINVSASLWQTPQVSFKSFHYHSQKLLGVVYVLTTRPRIFAVVFTALVIPILAWTW